MTRDLAALLVVFAKGWTSILQLEVERAGEHTRAVKGYRSPVVGLRITFWCHFVFLERVWKVRVKRVKRVRRYSYYLEPGVFSCFYRVRVKRVRRYSYYLEL